MVVTSYLQNNNSRQLFLKRHRELIQQVASVILALVLLIFDSRYHHNPIRYYLTHVSSGLQIIITRPMIWADDIHTFVFGQHHLQQENAVLKHKVLMAEAKLRQKNLELHQYQELKRWQDLHDPNLQFAMAANLLFLQVNPNRQIYILDKGRHDGIFEGQVAIDGHGLIGQIINIGEFTSTLMLISDEKSGVPVINKRNGEHGIVVGGSHPEQLQLLNIPKTNSVKVGDVLMTSGLGLVFPYGIPVGQVQSVESVPGEDFLAVEVRPMAKINQHHMVILLKPARNMSHMEPEFRQRLSGLEAGAS